MALRKDLCLPQTQARRLTRKLYSVFYIDIRIALQIPCICTYSYNYYMAMFSVTFLLLSYQLTNLLGPVGFILANCTNMIFRIGYSTFYIFKQFHTVSLNPLYGILPGKRFLSVLSICGVLCKVSEVRRSTQSNTNICFKQMY